MLRDSTDCRVPAAPEFVDLDFSTLAERLADLFSDLVEVRWVASFLVPLLSDFVSFADLVAWG